jgi:hypothetical protein
VGERPYRKLRTIRNPQLSKDPIQVFLDGAFREMQFVCNLLIQLGFTHKIHYLLFPKTQIRVKRLALLLWPTAI